MHVEVGGGCKNLGIPHPTQPLVALRTIGRHREEIPALSPGDIPVDLIDQFIGGFQFTNERLVRVDHFSDQGGLGRFFLHS